MGLSFDLRGRVSKDGAETDRLATSTGLPATMKDLPATSWAARTEAADDNL